MEILNIKVLRGPNFWSNYRKNLIEVKLDLKEYEQLPTNLLTGFGEALMHLIPSLFTHFCSRDNEGGFFERLKEGTWLGHVIEHIALELQSLAGMDCSFGRTRTANIEGTYYVIFSYEIENAGIYAAKAAFNIAKALAQGLKYENLENDIATLKKINSDEGLGISTKSLIKEAEKREIPYSRVDTKNSLIQLGYGVNQKFIWATIGANTSIIGVELAANKALTKKILTEAFIPVPQGMVLENVTQLDEAITILGFPLVIKPIDGNHGRGVTTNITTKEKAIIAFQLAQKISSEILVEHFVKGFDYRFLVINYKLAAVSQRIPAFIIGDGVSNIQALIERTNQDPLRGESHENVLTKITIDEMMFSLLTEKGLTLNSILPKEQILYLKDAANLSSGGVAHDVTDLVHPENIFLAERIARFMKLDICGIDIVTEDIAVPITRYNGAVIEVNAAPGIRMHVSPSAGKPRNIPGLILDLLYPAQAPSRIPIIAVTGTNGKTTTVRLITQFALEEGYNVGLTSTDGVYINNIQTYKGDCSGPTSAKAVLNDPLVNFAVLECARGGILRSGLGFDTCNISIITNITEDHLGLNGIDTLNDLARVKGVVARCTMKEGYAILNADDERVYALKEDVISHVALFSLCSANPYIALHCQEGGIACYLEEDYIILQNGNDKKTLIKITDIPLTYFGAAKYMVQNILAAILAAYLSKFNLENVLQQLLDLLPSAETTPGRMNLFDYENIQVLVDYAHNMGAFLALKEYLQQTKDLRKTIGIIGTPGDRRDEDIRNIGFIAAQMFDEIIIRHDKDGRGRTNQEITALLLEGIKNSNNMLKVAIISDEHTAIQQVLKEQANNYCFIVYLPENISKALNYLQNIEPNTISQGVLYDTQR